jgi:hypothetical protein
LWWHLDLDDVVLDGVNHQVANGMQTELAHDIAAMSFHGLGAQVQEYGHFLRTFAFGKKLRSFAFARAQRRQIRRLIPAYSMPFLEEACQHQVVYPRSEEHSFALQGFDCSHEIARGRLTRAQSRERRHPGPHESPDRSR